MQFAWKFGVVALVALVFVALPGGSNALDVVLTALTIAFFASIALAVAFFYRRRRLDIESLDPNIKLALYGSLAIVVAAFRIASRGASKPVQRSNDAAPWATRISRPSITSAPRVLAASRSRVPPSR